LTAFRIAHLSDLHLPPPPRRGPELHPKRLISRLAWRRKGRRHSPAARAAHVEGGRAPGPDHIVVTGDLTNFATPEEFIRAKRWLEDLAPAGQVTVSPGNHDALAGRAGPARFAPWRPWLGDAAGESFPHVRRRGPVAIVNLSSAAPTAPHLAQGVLDTGQLERLPAILRDLREEGAFRLLLLHHPPAPGVVSGRKSLRQMGELAAILRAEGCELVLHGHAHEATAASLAGRDGPIAVLGAPSASSTGLHRAAARWHLVEVQGAAGDWRVQVAARGLVGAQVQALGSYVLAPAGGQETASGFHRRG
jgi:3',5'-cyclic AMP phosphodiesterase CpdA